MEVDHRHLLSLLDDLMRPISTIKISPQDEEQEQILTINFVFSNACDRFIESSTSSDCIISVDNTRPAYFRYLQIHLQLLEKLLRLEEQTISSHIPLFSIQDESILSRSLSFVTLLGLVLHFDEGIYHSIENYLKNSSSSTHLLKLKNNLSPHDRMSTLHQVLTTFNKWLTTSHVNCYIIQRLYSYYLLEIILSHLQLLYSPNLKYTSEEISSEGLQTNFLYLQNNFTNLFIQQILLLNRLLTTTIHSPVWLKTRCGDLLTGILINKNNQGIRQLFQVILDSTTPNDRLYSSMAQILSKCPKQLQPDEYFQCIKSQLNELIHHPRYMPIICISINEFIQKYPHLVERDIFSVLFQPLISCRNASTDLICTEEQLEVFLNDLSNLIIIHPNESIRRYLYENYRNELLNISLALERSLSSVKLKYFNILIRIFSTIDPEKSTEDLEKLLFHFPYLPLKYLPTDSSNFHLIIDQDTNNNPEMFCQLISKILFSIDNHDRLIIKLFLHFLQLLITKNPIDDSLLSTEKETQTDLQQCHLMFFLKHTMEYLTEHIELFIENLDHTIQVIQILFEKLTTNYQSKANLSTKLDEDEDLSSDDEALQILFTIASLLITHYEQLSSKNKQMLASLYSPLTWFVQHHSNRELRQLAEELSIAFVTFGAIKDISLPSKSNLLIEEINLERDLREETFDNAFACLHDLSLPIRAHGLILFRRLIERSDEKTLEHFQENYTKLFQRFEEHLHAEDSYEYLAAINVLSALANRYTERVLPMLCHEYINQDRRLEDRLKVGEILVKTSRILGDMSAQYSSLLVNTFLHASKQTDDEIYRASALSNLGQLCTVLKYSLSKDLSEILTALKSYLSIFESFEVRRASILVCKLLCQSLEQSTWLTILGKELPSFYQLINHLYKTDQDEIVRLHAQIALEALNQISREYLQPPVTFEKKIRILS